MKLSTDARRFLLVPLAVIALGAVVTVGAWIWLTVSCCEGGANIGAGGLALFGLSMFAGGAVWSLLIVLVGLKRGK
ncbi:hypothetical protein ACT4S5_13100 [Kocuria oceani]|uniref:hypothetical protein n=1 Tax=Kocuria oceani TaxID=988827 RepID=UPI00403709C3